MGKQIGQLVPATGYSTPASIDRPGASLDEVRKLVGTLAATLKMARTSDGEGKFKLAVYQRVLSDVPLAALKYATEQAIRTMEWMPVPSELLKLADGYVSPDEAEARTLKALRQADAQRDHEQTLRAIRDKAVEDLAQVPPHTARVAETLGLLVIRIDGRRQYRTKETIAAHRPELHGWIC